MSTRNIKKNKCGQPYRPSTACYGDREGKAKEEKRREECIIKQEKNTGCEGLCSFQVVDIYTFILHRLQIHTSETYCTSIRPLHLIFLKGYNIGKYLMRLYFREDETQTHRMAKDSKFLVIVDIII
jgi:hypothetical protein